MKRRTFMQSVSLVTLMGSTLFQTGCATFQDILNYISIGLQALQSILGVLASGGVLISGGVTNALNLVKAGYADVETAVNDYNASTGNKGTLGGKISTAITVLQNDIGAFWSSLQIPDQKIAAVVSGILGVMNTTLAYFLTELPPVTTLRANLPAQISGPAQKRTRAEFVASVNQILSTNGFSQFTLK